MRHCGMWTTTKYYIMLLHTLLKIIYRYIYIYDFICNLKLNDIQCKLFSVVIC